MPRQSNLRKRSSGPLWTRWTGGSGMSVLASSRGSRGCRGASPAAAWMVAAWFVTLASTAGAQNQRVHSLKFDKDRAEWVEVAPPSPGTPAGDVHLVRASLAAQNHRQALSRVKAFVKRHGEGGERYPDLLLAQAEAEMGLHRFDKAHETLRKFLGQYSGIALTSEALRLEFEIAETWLGGVKRKFMGMRLLSGTEAAISILDEISSEYKDSALAELALKTKGDYMFGVGDYGLAELEYGRLAREYAQGRYHSFAVRRSADAALASFGGVVYDEASLVEAEERFNDYRRQYPSAADAEGVGLILDDVREKRAAKDYSIGEYYERTKHLRSAIYYYRLIVKNWAGTLAATKAAGRLELLQAPVEPSNAGPTP